MTMKNKVAPAIAAVLTALFIAALANAQSVGLGIKKDTTLQGTGSSGSPMGVNTTTLAGSGLDKTSTTLLVGAGTGITVTADAVAVDTTTIQARVTGTCAAGNAIRVIDAAGAVTCETTGVTYTAGDGLTLTALDFDLTYTSDFTITADQLDLSTAVTAPGTVSVAGVFDVDNALSKFGAAVDGATFISNASVNAEYGTNALGTLFFNNTGYLNGTTQFRDIDMRDGKSVTACYLTGSTKTLNCVGGLQVNGTSVVTTSNVSGTVGYYAKFSGVNTVGNSITTDDGVTMTVSGGLSVTNSATLGDATIDTHTVNGRLQGSSSGFANSLAWTTTNTALGSDTFGVQSTITGTYAAATARTVSAVYGVNTATKSSGASSLNNYGGIFDASGGDANYGVYATGTQWSLYGASGAFFNAGNAQINGNTTLGDANTDTTRINGQLSQNTSTAAGYEIIGTPANGESNFDINYASSDAKSLDISVRSASSTVLVTATNGFTFAGSATFNDNTQLGNLYTADFVGINTAPDANHQLTFNANTGNKIALFPVSGTAAVGFGVASDTLQYFVDNSGARHSFGYGDSDAFTESQRLDADGQVWLGDTANSAVSNNVDVVTIGNTGTGQTTSGTALIKTSHTGSFDTTAGTVYTYGLKIDHSPTVSAGANPLVSEGLYVEVGSGGLPYAAIFVAETGSATTALLASAAGTGSYTAWFQKSPVAFNDSLIEYRSSAIALSSCGSSPTVGSSVNQGGTITTGSGATACTITFAADPAWPNAPTCTVTGRNGTVPTYTTSTSALTLSAAGASIVYDYHCIDVTVDEGVPTLMSQ